MKRVIWVTVGLVVVAGLVAAAKSVGKSPGPGATQPADSTVEAVRRGDLVRSVASTGKVESNLDVDIKCRASGEVVKLPFDVSDSVRKGDLLVELDPADQQRDVKRAEATLAQAKAKLAEAVRNLEIAQLDVDITQKKADSAIQCAQIKAKNAQAKARRREQLAKEKLGYAEDLESTQADAASAQAELETAQLQLRDVKTRQLTVELRKHEIDLAQAELDASQIALDDARQQLAYTRVVAPTDGVVSARNVQIGTIIASGISNVSGGTTVLTLSDVSRIFVLASVDEADIGQVRIGQPARITADAFPSERFDGKVIRIATTGVNTSNVVTFEVKVEVTSPNKQLLKPIMTTNIQILCEQRQGVLLVPEQAVSRDGNSATVTIPGKADVPSTERPVVMGMSDGENVEVVQGLAEGEQVLVRKEAVSRWSGTQKKGGMGPPPPM